MGRVAEGLERSVFDDTFHDPRENILLDLTASTARSYRPVSHVFHFR